MDFAHHFVGRVLSLRDDRRELCAIDGNRSGSIRSGRNAAQRILAERFAPRATCQAVFWVALLAQFERTHRRARSRAAT
jgi:hypothetical protein